MTESESVADFSLPASTGQTLSLDSFRGKVPLVLVFLDPNRDVDLELLQELDTRHKDFGSQRIQVLAVAKITARRARDLADELDLSVPILADASGAMARDHGIDGLAAVVADREGRVVERLDSLGPDVGSTVASLLSSVEGLGPQRSHPGPSD